MLLQMGIQLPARFPLNRNEERALRTVRRKIRNKLSAQASRAKRQRYVASLEERLSISDKENQRLRRQIADLENDKRWASLWVTRINEVFIILCVILDCYFFILLVRYVFVGFGVN